MNEETTFAEDAKAIAACVTILSDLSGGIMACDRVVRVLNNMIADRAIIERTRLIDEADKAQAQLKLLLAEQKDKVVPLKNFGPTGETNAD